MISSASSLKNPIGIPDNSNIPKPHALIAPSHSRLLIPERVITPIQTRSAFTSTSQRKHLGTWDLKDSRPQRPGATGQNARDQDLRFASVGVSISVGVFIDSDILGRGFRGNGREWSRTGQGVVGQRACPGWSDKLLTAGGGLCIAESVFVDALRLVAAFLGATVTVPGKGTKTPTTPHTSGSPEDQLKLPRIRGRCACGSSGRSDTRTRLSQVANRTPAKRCAPWAPLAASTGARQCRRLDHHGPVAEAVNARDARAIRSPATVPSPCLGIGACALSDSARRTAEMRGIRDPHRKPTPTPPPHQGPTCAIALRKFPGAEHRTVAAPRARASGGNGGSVPAGSIRCWLVIRGTQEFERMWREALGRRICVGSILRGAESCSCRMVNKCEKIGGGAPLTSGRILSRVCDCAAYGGSK
ncbi:hypothetical protein B0H17DRAFT_1127258 [Mycena rosella]|uniref:Uncharacterized protein n=1 Tax=Mycena rosella TaxID=1033263 RepID=A0AAD7DZY9_MYCRO|nr:hypothetical protein B0H17DRAFT_1127258 [Mycena rosella]